MIAIRDRGRFARWTTRYETPAIKSFRGREHDPTGLGGREGEIFPIPTTTLDHLRRLTGKHGLYEHAEFASPRLEHGYTTDDNARALVVLSTGLDGSDPELSPYLDYVIGAKTSQGWHNRMSVDGVWMDRVGSDDAQGRAIWGLGRAMTAPSSSERAREALMIGLGFSSKYSRATAYAVLGAVSAITVMPESGELERFLGRAATSLPRDRIGAWAWPESRLTYDNARLPEALIAAGSLLGDRSMTDDGLALLDWLAEEERGDDGFSFTPVAGRSPGERGPAFDQQPLEAWAMADACLLAFTVASDAIWAERVEAAGQWFLGRNDVGVALFDSATGAGFDGLTAVGVNENQGAESTLAALGGLQAMVRLSELG